MASFHIELNSDSVKNTSEHSLLLRITINRKHARVKLNYAIQKRFFNSNPGEYKYIRTSHPKHAVINQHIDDKIQEAKDIISDLDKKKQSVTASIIRSIMLSPKSKSFLEYARKRANDIKSNNHIANYKKYNTLITKLSDYKKEGINFDQLTPTFLSGFESHLKSLGNNVNTVNTNLRTLRAIYYKGIEDGYADQSKNPFFTFKLKRGNSMKDRLNLEEIIKIEQLELEDGSLLDSVRNCFLFSFYNAGIRISDILLLTWDSIKEERLVYTMYKTNRSLSLKLKEKPLAILEKCKSKDGSYIFPFFSDKYDYSDPLFLHNQISAKTALINKYLKQIATKAKIAKKISTHTARHSFADIARQKINNIYNLSKTLNHSSLKVTETYLATFDQAAVDDTLDKMF